VLELLDAGYAVRAAVRDPGNARRNRHLTEGAAGKPGTLELVEIDLEKDSTFGPAFEGCDAVIHTASAVVLTARDPEREIVGVAVQGAANALKAATAARVRRVVMTSSVSAVVGDRRHRDHLFTEADWNDDATTRSDAYATSKVKAEREARRLAGLPGAPQLTCILPSLVLGPVLAEQHLRTSPAVLVELLKGAFPGVPDLHFGVVDVRDVAKAHVRAMEVERPAERYICSAAPAGLRDMARVLREVAPSAKVPRLPLPDALMYATALFEPRLTFGFLKKNLGRAPRFDNSRIRRGLGVEFRPVPETVADTARSILAGGWLSA
jgi:nucleoside-diphosphate-sugar epimerase